jgi:hypothetical protein
MAYICAHRRGDRTARDRDYMRFGEQVKGVHQVGNAILDVSAGLASAMMPLRWRVIQIVINARGRLLYRS